MPEAPVRPHQDLDPATVITKTIMRHGRPTPDTMTLVLNDVRAPTLCLVITSTADSDQVDLCAATTGQTLDTKRLAVIPASRVKRTLSLAKNSRVLWHSPVVNRRTRPCGPARNHQLLVRALADPQMQPVMAAMTPAAVSYLQETADTLSPGGQTPTNTDHSLLAATTSAIRLGLEAMVKAHVKDRRENTGTNLAHAAGLFPHYLTRALLNQCVRADISMSMAQVRILQTIVNHHKPKPLPKSARATKTSSKQSRHAPKQPRTTTTTTKPRPKPRAAKAAKPAVRAKVPRTV